jgi:hypothetical protein
MSPRELKKFAQQYEIDPQHSTQGGQLRLLCLHAGGKLRPAPVPVARRLPGSMGIYTFFRIFSRNSLLGR